MTRRFDTLPSKLRECSFELEIAGVPCLLARQDESPRPFLLWIHGRTADKELDPGRYLRCVRRGLHVCAVDLPGHGQRFDETLQGADRILDVILQMASEIDNILNGLEEIGGFDVSNAAIGGMSAGGFAAITRLLSDHPFRATVLEATGGDWTHLRSLPICKGLSQEEFDIVNPMNSIQTWRDIPVIAFHSRHDEWIPFATEAAFIEALRIQSSASSDIELVAFDRTGAPEEHMGFGRESAFVKEVQIDFLARHLLKTQEVIQ